MFCSRISALEIMYANPMCLTLPKAPPVPLVRVTTAMIPAMIPPHRASRIYSILHSSLTSTGASTEAIMILNSKATFWEALYWSSHARRPWPASFSQWVVLACKRESWIAGHVESQPPPGRLLLVQTIAAGALNLAIKFQLCSGYMSAISLSLTSQQSLLSTRSHTSICIPSPFRRPVSSKIWVM